VIPEKEERDALAAALKELIAEHGHGQVDGQSRERLQDEVDIEQLASGTPPED